MAATAILAPLRCGSVQDYYRSLPTSRLRRRRLAQRVSFRRPAAHGVTPDLPADALTDLFGKASHGLISRPSVSLWQRRMDYRALTPPPPPLIRPQWVSSQDKS
jgi:hypothetical protein